MKDAEGKKKQNNKTTFIFQGLVKTNLEMGFMNKT